MSLSELLELAKSAALAAGKIIQGAHGHHHSLEMKSTGTSLASQVVTEIDRLAQAAILQILKPTLNEIGLLTEESEDDKSRFEKETFWCIDPLDGTLPFSQGKPGYSTSIALVSRNGQALLGVVYNPATKDCYWAIKGDGAYKNGHPFSVAPLQSSQECLVMNSGPAVTNALRTLEINPSLYVKKPKAEQGGGSVWDFAATSVIHQEAGGYHSDYNGKPLQLNPDGSTFMNHCGVLFLSSEELLNKINLK